MDRRLITHGQPSLPPIAESVGANNDQPKPFNATSVSTATEMLLPDDVPACKNVTEWNIKPSDSENSDITPISVTSEPNTPTDQCRHLPHFKRSDSDGSNSGESIASIEPEEEAQILAAPTEVQQAVVINPTAFETTLTNSNSAYPSLPESPQVSDTQPAVIENDSEDHFEEKTLVPAADCLDLLENETDPLISPTPTTHTNADTHSTPLASEHSTGDEEKEVKSKPIPEEQKKQEPLSAPDTKPASSRSIDTDSMSVQRDYAVSVNNYANEIKKLPAKLDPIKGRKALSNCPPRIAAVSLQFDEVGLIELNQAIERLGLLATQSGEPITYLNRENYLLPILTSKQKKIANQHRWEYGSLWLSESTKRGKPFCQRMLDELQSSCEKQKKDLANTPRPPVIKSSPSLLKYIFGYANNYFTQPKVEKQFTVSAEALKEIHEQVFTSPGHKLKNDFRAGEVVNFQANNTKGYGDSVGIVSFHPPYPQLTQTGMDEAHAFREDQKWRLGLDGSHPTFAIMFPKLLEAGEFSGLCIPLSLEQAKLLASITPMVDDKESEKKDKAVIVKVLNEIYEQLVQTQMECFPDSFKPKLLHSCLVTSGLREIFADRIYHNLPTLLRFKCLPARKIEDEFKRELGNFNKNLSSVKTIEDVCKVVGKHIPRLTQIHPFHYGNRFIFAQYAKEILLHYGYPSLQIPNFKLCGMISCQEMSQMLIEGISAYKTYEDFWRNAPPTQEECSSEPLEAELAPTIRLLEKLKEKDKQSAAYETED